ncbi:alpha/beta hydrolase [Parvularcula maris]|uniref:Alpha/beta hydrolase n=1 Tax=Parvularcula maris TaxID=2965077 RepID=A0A9X2L760_9PROT|nr:alpha/beta hydrolase [Parvularcula maris]MCQ8184313.1 alpha/beta hydrolase [Parvularcula maris]
MLIRTLLLAAALLLAACGDSEPSSAPAPGTELMGWEELTSRPLPRPDRTVRYADHEAGIADLWLPEGEGPHPAVLMIHGGCWQKAIADRTLMNYAADDLRRRGLAVFNIEYRGVDEEGGGYLGTYEDVAAAEAHLFEEAETLGIDPSRVAGFGHSAGGHLVAWLSARHNLDGENPLGSDTASAMRTALVSGGLADLEASKPVTLTTCLADVMDKVTGRPTPERPNPLADTSPVLFQPAGPEQISVHAANDRIAPPLLGRGYTDRVIEGGGPARYIEVPGGHVELIAPGTEAWEAQAELLMEAVGLYE